MNKQILIPYDEYLELSSDASNGRELLARFKECTRVENLYDIGSGIPKVILIANTEKLKETIKEFLKVDEVELH